ncbi:MAG: GNAT family N-acetyltransferase [Planctomycetes bacterium RBG_16_55_9]|nr:MAG: GNAT family N-acetyltransferase [Planctomycetes bacterium RBG_16_55_9]
MLQNVKIRPEQPGDAEDISRITELAFRTCPYGNHTEQFIIEELRRSNALSVSLVAEVDKQIVGHVAFSPVEISDGSKKWYALGPVSVAPEFQGQGIGKAIINAGLDALRRLEADGCVLVGEPDFYARFGFRSRPNLIMEGVPQKYVQSLNFRKRSASGKITHHAAFGAKG